MATTAKNVVVIQDASKGLNLRVFYWIIKALSLEPEDMVTVVAILHEVYTPMGYRITVDNRLVGVNQRIIDKALANKKEEYLNNEELAQIAKQYESNKVGLKIKLFTGSPLKDVALEVAIDLQATWVILDRKMKKDEEFFLQRLSCGISILKSNDRILRLRGPLNVPDEIPCNSHETYDESLPSVPYKHLFDDIDAFPKRQLEDDEQNQIHIRPCCSNNNIYPTSPNHQSMDGTEINSNQMIDKIERAEQGHHHEQMQSMSLEMVGDTTIMITTDQATAQEIADQPSKDEERRNNFFHGENWDWSNPEESEEMLDQPIDHLPSQNHAQTSSIFSAATLDGGEQEKSILENSMYNICSVCKTRRPNIWGQKEFTYDELLAATDAFSLKNCLSKSGSLFTFRGQMEGGMKLVVKKHDATNTQVREKAKSEIQTILKARHKNVIMLLGSSTAESFLFTVYEYACNGSLDKYLSKESSRPLIWKERKQVVIGLARGLKEDYEYVAPEFQEKGKLSSKADVYSFGVVILELIAGRRTTDFTSEHKSLVEWAKPLLKKKNYSELVDPIIRNSYEEDHLRWMVQVITECLEKNPKKRSSMNMVVSALQGIADSELDHMTDAITPAVSDSRSVPEINGSQDVGSTKTKADQQNQKVEQIESILGGEKNKLRLTVENNLFYKANQGNSDKLRHNEEQKQSRSRGEDRSSGKMITNDHRIDETEVGLLNEFENQIPRTLHMESITTQKISVDGIMGNTKVDQLSQDQEGNNFVKMMEVGLIPATISAMIDQTEVDQPVHDKTQTQRSFHENLQDGCQGEIVLENSKSSACSICRSRRPNNACSKDFTYDELLEATEGFSTENSLSVNEDGPTFQGLLEGRVKIVVKKYQVNTSQEQKIINSEAKLLISARHKNVVMLLGLCTNESQLMVVFEKVCNGSLDQYLTTPEFLENGKLSYKTDVYSFGVVLLELISGRRAADKLPDGKSLVNWARPLLTGKKYHILLDGKISNSCEEEKLVWLVQVTEQCLKKNPNDRYSMNVVPLVKWKSSACHNCPKSQMKADLGKKQEQELIHGNQYKEESSPRLTVKTNHMKGHRNEDQMIQGEEDVQRSPYEEMFGVRPISNGMIDQINPVQQFQEKLHIKGSFEIEEMSKNVDKQQKVSKDKKQIQGSCDDSLLNGIEGKIILGNSKSYACSICKSRRPNSRLQRKYTYEELQACTEGFSVKYSLCEGEYGPAFRGQLENNQEIVIKQHAFTNLQEQKVFMSEFQLLINARHENVIMLLGSCIRLSQLLIVYEKACNGSLDLYLSRESGRTLTWGERVKVAIGVARGLNYLHENNIAHGGIKPSNILLNHELKPLVGDFAFGKERCELKNLKRLKRMRNCGRTAPECCESGILSTKADVYSFGIVLVELITGRMISEKVSGERCPTECIRSLLEEQKFLQLVDPKVSSSYDEQELVSLVHVIENCLKKNPEERFTMDMVVSALPSIVDCSDIYAKEDFSPENSHVSEVTNSKVKEEPPNEEDLSIENSEEKGDNITYIGGNETEIRQECDINPTGCENSKETEEKESLSTKICWEGCSSYGGAREFYLEGIKDLDHLDLGVNNYIRKKKDGGRVVEKRGEKGKVDGGWCKRKERKEKRVMDGKGR
ncbi:Proline-rich receptor-like protein [Vigna angularis]|uniref:Proline-rich receptor-like protein n=1 Tax=Phaseolus angularis TaxID=3914 RepID=A0A8T0K4I6_PHAAN|nr:Proline-rich receptor-like protein [Vigna angularis]